MKKVIKKVLDHTILLLGQIPPVRIFSQRIADYARGENNCDMELNGEISLLKRNTKFLGVVFDVGANRGDWSAAARRENPMAKIFAFEPEPDIYKMLRGNLANSGAVCENFGLGSKREERRIFSYKEDSGMGSFLSRPGRDVLGADGKVAEIRTLDDYCQANNIDLIDFLKIDVEGFEYEVILGARKLLSEHKISAIQFEYGGTYLDAGISLKDMFEFLSGFGYSLYKIYPNQVRLVLRYSPGLDNFQYANYLAVSSANKQKIY